MSLGKQEFTRESNFDESNMSGESQEFSGSKLGTRSFSSEINEVVLGYFSSHKQNFFRNLEGAALTWTGRFGPDGPLVSVRLVNLSHDTAEKESLPGPVLHAILHKGTDDMFSALTMSSEDALMRLSRFIDILGKYRFPLPPFVEPTAAMTRKSFSVVAIDPIQGVWKLRDRKIIYESVDNLFRNESRVQFDTNYEKVDTLPWVLLSVRQSDEEIRSRLQDVLKFPVIIKRRAACGSTKCHDMVIAYDIDGAIASMQFVFGPANRENREGYSLGKVIVESNREESHPEHDFAHDLIAQEFVSDHGGVVFKIYAIGNKLEVHPRLSVDHRVTFSAGGFYYFNSNNPGMKGIISDEIEQFRSIRNFSPSLDLATSIVRGLSGELAISLFGVDVLYDIQVKRYCVVDINYFPAYRGVENAYNWVLEHCCNLVWEQTMQKRRDETN